MPDEPPVLGWAVGATLVWGCGVQLIELELLDEDELLDDDELLEDDEDDDEDEEDEEPLAATVVPDSIQHTHKAKERMDLFMMLSLSDS